MPVPTRAFHHVAIATADREPLLAWYQRVLGFERGDDLGSPEQGFQATWLHKHGASIEVFHCPASRALSDADLALRDSNNIRGVVHLCLQVDDMAASLDAARAQGIAEIRGPYTDQKAGVMVAFFPDPDRNWIELLQNI
jgi:catechol 2,3-dioxygenase-like lactoylglutathione lyase family enzyme